MKYIITLSCYLFVIVVFPNCTGTQKEKLNSDSIVNRILTDSEKAIPYRALETAHIDFFKLANETKEVVRGWLQEVNFNDSSGPYVRKEFISDSLSFELIFFPRTIPKDSVTFKMVDTAGKNNYKDFYCFSFVFPMNAQTIENYHEDNTPYPVKVKSYILINGEWKLLSTSTANNLKELSSTEIKAMYANRY